MRKDDRGDPDRHEFSIWVSTESSRHETSDRKQSIQAPDHPGPDGPPPSADDREDHVIMPLGKMVPLEQHRRLVFLVTMKASTADERHRPGSLVADVVFISCITLDLGNERLDPCNLVGTKKGSHACCPSRPMSMIIPRSRHRAPATTSTAKSVGRNSIAVPRSGSMSTSAIGANASRRTGTRPFKDRCDRRNLR